MFAYRCHAPEEPAVFVQAVPLNEIDGMLVRARCVKALQDLERFAFVVIRAQFSSSSNSGGDSESSSGTVAGQGR